MDAVPRVLVVDDEPEIVGLLQLFLEDDFRVEVFTDPRVACDAVKLSHFDLVISDIKMPYIDGLEVLKFVKKHSAKTVVVLITGHAQTEQDRKLASELGASGILFKPFGDPAKVIKYLMEAVGRTDTQTQIQSSLKAPEARSIDSAKKKVLVLDDEIDLVDIFSSILSDQYDVSSFVTPQDALDEIRKSAYDCIITDLSMPLMGGAQIISEFKAASPGTPVIIVTGHAFEDLEVKEAFAAGACDLLPKPFPVPKEIFKLIGKHMK